MKVFRKLTVLVLALALIAAVGISASAASFREQNIFGDFGTGAIFSGILTSKTITATAEFIPVYESNVLQNQAIRTEYVVLRNGRETDYSVSFATENNENVVNYYCSPLGSGYTFDSAKYYYNAYYIANGVVDCYLSSGPQELAN